MGRHTLAFARDLKDRGGALDQWGDPLLTTLPGGLVVSHGSALVGAVGAGGGGPHDEEVARIMVAAMGFAVGALAALGEAERAKEWAERALLLDPDNVNLRYNFACSLITDLHDYEAALDMLAPRFETMGIEVLNWVKSDPDLDPIRDDPRFKAMLAAAEARLAQS